MQILIADDHEVVRAGCRRLFEGAAHIKSVEEVDNTEALFQSLANKAVDLVVLDLSLPSSGGMECLKRIVAKYSDLKVLIFTIYDNPLLVERCIQSGALGYVTKSSDSSELLAAIVKLKQGQLYISQDVSSVLAIQKLKKQDNNLSQLSSRELEIFLLVAHGFSVKEIAEKLFLAEKTISNYVSQIKQKLGIESTAKWVHLAIDHDLITNKKVIS